MGQRFPYDLVYERLPSAVLVADLTGLVVHANQAAGDLLGSALERDAVRCCDVFGCRRPGTALASACVTELALGRTTPTGEVRVDVALDGREAAPVWLSAAALGGVDAAVVLQVRAADGGERRRRGVAEPMPGSILRIHTLGRMRLANGELPLEADWLAHRPGELLKYLVVERGRIVSVEELLETFWRDGARASATNVRQAVHTLRDRLEPRREKRGPSHYVVARRGGYELHADHVWIDTDEFETAARSGLRALGVRRPAEAEDRLQRAAALYRGDFLADDPYAEWALVERDRLRDLAAEALRALAALRHERDDGQAALEPLQRLAEIEPFDDRSQRELLEQLLRIGRHAEAQRRYQLIRRRFRRAFGSEPDWELAELLPY